jgi:MoxR-like ATPase
VVLHQEEILQFQQRIRRVPVTDHVLSYAVGLVNKTRPGEARAHELAEKYLEWGAGPRASQYLIYGAKCHAIMHGKYAPDIEDVQAVAEAVLSHRIVRNFKAEAEGYDESKLIQSLL